MHKKLKNSLIFLVVILVYLSALLFVILASPKNIVDYIGVNNTYFVIFIVALIVGVSAVTGVYFYSLLITFALGGANPILLGICAGLGLTLSDWLFFYLGERGRFLLSTKNLDRVDKFAKYLEKKPKWVIPFIVFVYSAFSPFPTDIITATTGLLGIHFTRILIPLLIGNMFSSFLVAFLATRGFYIFT